MSSQNADSSVLWFEALFSAEGHHGQPDQRRRSRQRHSQRRRLHATRPGGQRRALLSGSSGRAAPAPRIPQTKVQTMNKVLGDKRAILILLGPALLFYSVIMLVPIVWSMYYTVQDGNPIVGFTFNGLQNFAKFFQDPDRMGCPVLHPQVRGRADRAAGRRRIRARAAVRLLAAPRIRHHPHRHLLPRRPADSGRRAAVPATVRSRADDGAGQLVPADDRAASPSTGSGHPPPRSGSSS